MIPERVPGAIIIMVCLFLVPVLFLGCERIWCSTVGWACYPMKHTSQETKKDG